MRRETLAGSFYDYPAYYDIVFGADWQTELRFLKRCFRAYVSGEVKSVFEPACGTGRLLYRLAKLGFQVSGLDLNDKSVAYCNARLQRLGYSPSVVVADMCDFQLSRPVDAAFNMINSVRHLSSEEAIHQHLRHMVAALRAGGIYVVGLHLTPTRGTPLEEEVWQAQRGVTRVKTRLKTTERDLRRRVESCALTLDVNTPRHRWRLEDTLLFRTYTWPQWRDTLASVPEFEIAAFHDFSYSWPAKRQPNESTEDLIVVLRRR